MGRRRVESEGGEKGADTLVGRVLPFMEDADVAEGGDDAFSRQRGDDGLPEGSSEMDVVSAPGAEIFLNAALFPRSRRDVPQGLVP